MSINELAKLITTGMNAIKRKHHNSDPTRVELEALEGLTRPERQSSAHSPA